MNQMGYYNDIDFGNSYFTYHQGDNSLRCQNNILYYEGPSSFIVGRCGVQKGECINLGSFRIGTIDNPVWKLEPHVLFFLIKEYINIQNTSDNLPKYFEILEGLLNKSILTTEETKLIMAFTDYYKTLKKYEKYLRGGLLDNFDTISKWLNKELSSGKNTSGYKQLYNGLFEEVKNNEEQTNNTQGNSNGIARTRIGSVPRNTNFIPQQSSDAFFNEFNDSKLAFTNLIMIIFLIIITVAIVLTLLFL